MRRSVGIVSVVAAAVSAGFAFLRFQRWQQAWGTRGDEATAPLPGDEAVAAPASQVTRAIDVNAPPEDVFVWVQQMGSDRGGLYSYDALDRLFGFLDRPSVEHVVPEWQNLQQGDVIQVNRSPGWPVYAIERDRLLVFAGEQDGAAWLWSMVLRPLPDGRTRFITRNRMRAGGGPVAGAMMFVLDLAAFVMVRKWLLRIRSLAERRAADRAARRGEFALTEAH